MESRELGTSGIKVKPLCLGGNVFGWTIDEKNSFEVLDAFVAKGFNFIDTADVYSRWASGVGGESETIIGKWMKSRGNRTNIILATKAGMDMGQGKTDVTRKYILKAAEASLKRLQTDYIDLYQTHKDDEGTPVEEALSAYDQLVKEGKVRIIGASNFSPERLADALSKSEKLSLPKYQTLQPLYNLYDREDFEQNLLPLCLENKISVINYYSLAAGFLTGKYRTLNDTLNKVRGVKAATYLNPRGLRILEAMDGISARYNCQNASVAIAWLLTRPGIAAPIASATSVSQLQNLFRGVELQLNSEDISILNEASEK